MGLLGKFTGIQNSGLSYEILKDDGSTIRGRHLIKNTNSPFETLTYPEFPEFDDDVPLYNSTSPTEECEERNPASSITASLPKNTKVQTTSV